MRDLVRRAPPMTDAECEAAREWLGGEHDGLSLRGTIIETMMAGFEKKPPIWNSEDVTNLGTERRAQRDERMAR